MRLITRETHALLRCYAAPYECRSRLPTQLTTSPEQCGSHPHAPQQSTNEAGADDVTTMYGIVTPLYDKAEEKGESERGGMMEWRQLR